MAVILCFDWSELETDLLITATSHKYLVHCPQNGSPYLKYIVNFFECNSRYCLYSSSLGKLVPLHCDHILLVGTSGCEEEYQTQETEDYNAEEVYLDLKMSLYKPPSGKLQPYNYSFPFSMQLPKHLPSSFKGSCGDICYQVIANVHRSGMHTATSVSSTFTVVRMKDLNFSPKLQYPFAMNEHKKFGALFWKSKPLTAKLCINKQAFVSGEEILVSGVINNESDIKIKECVLKLIQTTTYHASSSEKYNEITIRECTQPAIDKGSKADWLNIPISVPDLAPSGLDGCSIISPHYILLIRIVPPGIHYALELSFSIIIGTIPFHQQLAPPPPMPGPTGVGYAPMPRPTGVGYAPMPGPTGVGYAPMPGPTGVGYAPMPGPTGAGYTPMTRPTGAGYTPMTRPTGVGYAPMPGPTGTGYAPMPGPTGAGYTPMPGPTGTGYTPMPGPTGAG